MYSKLQDGSYIICGYVAKDAESRPTQNGGLFVTWGVAVGKIETNGEQQTVWTNCKAFGRAAEVASGIVKGDTVLCIGRIEQNEYQGKTYKNLVCEYVSIMSKSAVNNTAPQNSSANNQTSLNDLGNTSDYESIYGGDDLPF